MRTMHNGLFRRSAQDSEIAALTQQKYTRRTLLKQAALAGAVGIGLLGLAACGGDAAKPAEQAKQPASDEKQTACTTSGDPAADAGARKALKYVDQSADSARICTNCRFFKRPEANAACGGCLIITGPIAPAGYCSTWTAPS